MAEETKRREFLKKIGKAGLGIAGIAVGGGLFYKACIDQFIDHMESFSGFQEKAEDGWKVKDVDIWTKGDIVFVQPGSEGELERKVLPDGDVKYSGSLRYQIRKQRWLEPKGEYLDKYYRDSLKSGDFWWDERYGSVILSKKKK